MDIGFYIGQKVVCIKTSKTGLTIKGKTYIVTGVTACKCGTVLSLEGVNVNKNGCKCKECGVVVSNKEFFNRSNRFKPLDFATEILENLNIKELELA